MFSSIHLSKKEKRKGIIVLSLFLLNLIGPTSLISNSKLHTEMDTIKKELKNASGNIDSIRKKVNIMVQEDITVRGVNPLSTDFIQSALQGLTIGSIRQLELTSKGVVDKGVVDSIGKATLGNMLEITIPTEDLIGTYNIIKTNKLYISELKVDNKNSRIIVKLYYKGDNNENGNFVFR